jgi:hypothetical protein
MPILPMMNSLIKDIADHDLLPLAGRPAYITFKAAFPNLEMIKKASFKDLFLD